MLRVPDDKCRDFISIFNNHRLHNSAANIFYNHIKLINNSTKYLDRNTYKEFFEPLLLDVELVTSPIDAFIPSDDDANKRLFVTNQIVPEYIAIKEKVSIDTIKDTLPITHDVCCKLADNANVYDDIIDDIFINFCIYRYLAQIDLIRMTSVSNYTEIIEYVVDNITLKDIKSFLVSKKINEDKYIKYCSDILFNPDVSRTQKFYSTDHGDINAFDPVGLMKRLSSNIVLKTDIYIILGIYMIMSFAIADIVNENINDSRCVAYVRDVLSKL